MSTIGEKVRRWRERMGWSTTRLAEAIGHGVKRQNIEQLESGEVDRPRYLPELAKAMGRTVENLADTRLELDLDDPRAPYAAIRDDTAPPAHPMSYVQAEHPPLLAWSTIVEPVYELPERFRCDVPDDALYSDKDGGTRRGTPVVFVRTAKLPGPGTGVLVQDSHGARYIRIYRQGVGGAWLAAARNPNYLTLHSVEHGLQLLGVAEHRLLDGSL